MSAEGTARAVLYGLVLCSGASALAEDEEVPDMEFLEYLGMWEESDEDWVIVNDAITAVNEERSDPVPEGEESMEKEDES